MLLFFFVIFNKVQAFYIPGSCVSPLTDAHLTKQIFIQSDSETNIGNFSVINYFNYTIKIVYCLFTSF